MVDTVTQNFIHRYLESQNFIECKKNLTSYFVTNENDEYCVLKYERLNERCIISEHLVFEISSIFCLSKLFVSEIVGKWVKNKLNIEVNNIFIQEDSSIFLLV